VEWNKRVKNPVLSFIALDGYRAFNLIQGAV
jgi:hypothetical protein